MCEDMYCYWDDGVSPFVSTASGIVRDPGYKRPKTFAYGDIRIICWVKGGKRSLATARKKANNALAREIRKNNLTYARHCTFFLDPYVDLGDGTKAYHLIIEVVWDDKFEVYNATH